MSIQFKVLSRTSLRRREEIIDALRSVGFEPRALFPRQTRPELASVYTISEAARSDLGAVEAALEAFGKDVEYVEVAPDRAPR